MPETVTFARRGARRVSEEEFEEAEPNEKVNVAEVRLESLHVESGIGLTDGSTRVLTIEYDTPFRRFPSVHSFFDDPVSGRWGKEKAVIRFESALVGGLPYLVMGLDVDKNRASENLNLSRLEEELRNDSTLKAVLAGIVGAGAGTAGGRI